MEAEQGLWGRVGGSLVFFKLNFFLCYFVNCLPNPWLPDVLLYCGSSVHILQFVRISFKM